MQIQKPSYIVHRKLKQHPPRYEVVIGKDVTWVTRNGKYWFCNTRYYKTLRDAIMEIVYEPR